MNFRISFLLYTENRYLQHKYSTANFKISHRKLNMLGRQIAGKPVDHAIVQMQFSEKRASSRIMNMLVTARDHAYRYKGLDHDKLVVGMWPFSVHPVRRLLKKLHF